MITPLWWLLLYGRNGGENTTLQMAFHSVPLAGLVIDWHLSRIVFEQRQVAAHMTPPLAYVAFTVAYQLSTGDAVYFFLDITKATAWLFVAGLLVLGVCLIYVLAAYSHFRFWANGMLNSQKLSHSKNISQTAVSEQLVLIVLESA